MRRAQLWRKTFGCLAVVALAACPGSVSAREVHTVNSAIEVLANACSIPDKCIPAALLKDAAGVAIFPGVLKAGFVFGGRFGRGVILIRCQDGTWSNPVFLNLAGGSFGAQIGAQSTDLVLVFRTTRSIERILQNKGKVTLGGDVAVAAGPVGRQVGAGTDGLLKAEIYSYSRSRGLFAGASLEGAALTIDWSGNGFFYNRRNATPYDVLTNNAIVVPQAALKLRATLNGLCGVMTAPPVILAPPTTTPTTPTLPPLPPPSTQPPALSTQPPPFPPRDR